MKVLSHSFCPCVFGSYSLFCSETTMHSSIIAFETGFYCKVMYPKSPGRNKHDNFLFVHY